MLALLDFLLKEEQCAISLVVMTSWKVLFVTSMGVGDLVI